MHDKWTGPELDSLLGKSALTRREALKVVARRAPITTGTS